MGARVDQGIKQMGDPWAELMAKAMGGRADEEEEVTMMRGGKTCHG